MARSGDHQGKESKGGNTVSSVSDRGELGFGEGNRRGNTSRVGIGTKRRLTFRREYNSEGRHIGDWAYIWEASTARRGVPLGQ